MADNVPITAGSGTTIATDDIGGTHYQRIKRSVGADGAAADFLDKASRADTFTAAGNGTTVDVSGQGMSRFGLQVKGTGAAPTSWTVVLEASLDGTTFTEVLSHSNTGQADGGMVVTSVPFPALYFRSRCSAVTLGSATNIVARIVGLP